MSPVLSIFQSHAYDTVWVNDNRLNCDPIPGVSTASTGSETSPTVPTGVTRDQGSGLRRGKMEGCASWPGEGVWVWNSGNQAC